LVVVGDSTSANSGFGYFEAFRWTEAGGMVGLGDLPGGLFYSVANAVSGGGSVIVGSGHTDSGFQATIWDATHGTRNLRDVLVNDYGMGASLAGWELASATGISADGLTIVGTGSSPSSGSEAFLVHLNSPVPEPSTVVLFALGVAFYMGTRRICTARTRP
jgi:uncharacterized membrane protein